MNFDWQTFWFVLVGVLLTGYAVLDGLDLGVGALHLFTREDKDRRLLLNAIGPVWDGNEVWLVTGGGALFAAFPEVYATVFSGFYLAFMLLLFCLIFRAVSIEFRSQRSAPVWRRFWDSAFSVSSGLAAFLLGVAVGNIAWGIPLGADHEFAGTFLGLLHPYALLTGAMAVALFMMHGALYLVLKTEGGLQVRVKGWLRNAIVFFIVCYAATTVATVVFLPHMVERFKTHPILFLVPLLNILLIAMIPRCAARGLDFQAFLSSCLAIVCLMALFGIGMYPDMVLSNPLPENSLNIANASSSLKTLKIMALIAAIGMPLVLAYTFGVYRVFRGKVKLETHSY